MPSAESPAKLFLAGMAVTLGNPKIMMFYLALLPTIIDLGSVTLLGWAELTADDGARACRHRPVLGARRRAGAQVAEERARHEDRQPRQRHHHGGRRRGDRRALHRPAASRRHIPFMSRRHALPAMAPPGSRQTGGFCYDAAKDCFGEGFVVMASARPKSAAKPKPASHEPERSSPAYLIVARRPRTSPPTIREVLAKAAALAAEGRSLAPQGRERHLHRQRSRHSSATATR